MSGLIYKAFECVMTFGLICVVGYYMCGRGVLGLQTRYELSRFLALVCLPAFLFYNIIAQMHREQFFALLGGLLTPFISMIINIVLAGLLGRALNVDRKHRGVFLSSVAFSNTMYIGLPVNVALFGSGAIPYVLLYYFSNTLLFWSLGNNFISADAAGDMRQPFFSLTAFRRAFLNPPLMATIFGLLYIIYEVKMPLFFEDACRSLGQMATPLILVIIGMNIHEIGFSRIFSKCDREMCILLVGRFLLSPLVVVFVTWLLPVPEEIRKVFIIQSSLPVMSNVTMLANYYKADIEFATIATSLSTVLCVLTVPISAFMLTLVF